MNSTRCAVWSFSGLYECCATQLRMQLLCGRAQCPMLFFVSCTVFVITLSPASWLWSVSRPLSLDSHLRSGFTAAAQMQRWLAQPTHTMLPAQWSVMLQGPSTPEQMHIAS